MEACDWDPVGRARRQRRAMMLAMIFRTGEAAKLNRNMTLGANRSLGDRLVMALVPAFFLALFGQKYVIRGLRL